MLGPGWIGWISWWPDWEGDVGEHPIIIVGRHGGLLRCLPISHSVDLFDRQGSIRISRHEFPELYPPLVDHGAFHGKTDYSYLGVKVDGTPAWVECAFDHDHNITNIAPHPVTTRGWRQIPAAKWMILIRAISQVAKPSVP